MLRRPKATLTRSKRAAGEGQRLGVADARSAATTPSSSRRSRPARSIASLMSVCTTMPARPDAARRRRAPGRRCRRRCRARVSPGAQRSPPPPCRPSRRDAGRATSGRSSGRTSARPSRTRRARACAFSLSSTVSKPKWVSLMSSAQCSGRGRSRRRLPVIGGVAIGAGLRQALLVLLPQLVLLRAEEVEVVPGEDAGVVAVGEASAARRSCRPARAPSISTSRLPVCSTSWPGPWPCTSADGE